ncbi:sensor histidine kinase [Streptomyces sp. NPDC051286]|uniref:sensor histidine kinase n=1 Tax=Streptomyces sp. NPDC051286 TaxID=3365647 RepID=UPI0037A2972B
MRSARRPRPTATGSTATAHRSAPSLRRKPASRTALTTATCGSRATRPAVPAPISAKSTALIRRSVGIAATASRPAVALSEDSATVIALTSATHTVTAPAVAVVRRGLRRALANAKVPRVPASRRIGARSTWVTARANCGVSRISPASSTGVARDRTARSPSPAALWFAAALAAVLGLYLRLLDRYRAQEHRAGLQAQRLDHARELHDFVGHHVTAIIAQSKAVRFATAAGCPPSTQELDGMFAAIEEAGSQAMQSMRSMVAVLRSPGAATAPGGELADLRTLTQRFARTGPATTLALDPRLAAGGLPPGIATTVHQIVRESLTNVRKHARRAKAVTVDVRLDGDTARPAVLVSVTDEGPGTAGHTAEPADLGDGPRSGYGLVGLSERAAMVGGTVTAGAQAGVGWIVEARIPLPGPLPEPPLGPGEDRTNATLDA